MAQIITAEGVGFRYAGTPVLNEVTLGVDSAETLVLTGPNGSGKSTLLHLLAGVEVPSEGTVRRREGLRLALLPQRTSGMDALPLTVAECVRIGRFTPGRLLRRLTRSDHTAVADVLAQLGLTALAGRRLRELSGGQRQRTLLAQTLVQDADVYALDEPTAALDAASAHRVRELLAHRRQEGASIVLASHDDAESALADRTVELGHTRTGAGSRRRA